MHRHNPVVIILTPVSSFMATLSVMPSPGEEEHEVFFEGGKLRLSSEEETLLTRICEAELSLGELDDQQHTTALKLVEHGLAVPRLAARF